MNADKVLASIDKKLLRQASLIPEEGTEKQPENKKIDYVLVVKVPEGQDAKSAEVFDAEVANVLVHLLTAGLFFQLEYVPGKLLVLIHCPDSVLRQEYFQARLSDWLKGVGHPELNQVKEESLKDMRPNTRLRLIQHLIHVDSDKLKYALYPLHDQEFNKDWMKSWSTKWLLDLTDFTAIRNHFGEQVAYYFVYLQFYFAFLAVPTALGLVFYIGSSSEISIWYSVITCLWALVYVEMWERQEKNLAVYWGVVNVSKNDQIRQQFKEEKMVKDPVTGEMVKYYPRYKRWMKVLISFPVLLLMAMVLTLVMGLIFVVEMVFTEYYEGPFKSLLGIMPTVVYAALMPQLTNMYANLSRRMNDLENHETHETYRNRLVQKLFISHFVINFSYPLLNGLLYVPFGQSIAQFVQSLGYPVTIKTINATRFKDSVIAFIMTGQLLNAFLELVLPFIMRKLFAKKTTTPASSPRVEHEEKMDDPKKKTYLQTVVEQVESEYGLEDYDINLDYAEMVMQFGYVVMFGPVWTLTALASFVNNWLEVRSDMLKICMNARRPVPRRVDSIGPWLSDLKLLAWLGAIFNTVWILMFRFNVPLKEGMHTHMFGFVVTEHFFFFMWWVVRVIMGAFPTAADIQQRHDDWKLKRKYLSLMSNDGDVSLSFGDDHSFKLSQLREKTDELKRICQKGVRDLLKHD